MSKRLEKIETHLQNLIEGAAKIFTSGDADAGLLAQLIRCMRENSSADGSGVLIAPTRYLVELNPSATTGTVIDPARLEQMKGSLISAAEEAGIILHTAPELIIRTNPTVARGEFLVSAEKAAFNPGNTASVNILEEAEAVINLPQGAFLIINGSETVQLEKAVINMGRRPSNDIVLDDPRVSRNHAQLRLVKGSYVVFDLDSSGGTFVNNLPVRQKELFAGDVISLAGVQIIFGQDSGVASNESGDQTPTNQLLSNKEGEEK
jgi:hypothetical protein